MPPLPLTVTAHEQRSRPFSSQRIVNIEALPAQARSKSDTLWVGRPGMVYEVGTDRGPGFGCRGAFTWRGAPYFVNGTELNTVDASGTRTTVGAVPGAGPVSMTGTQSSLVVSNGFGRYTWDGSTFTDVSSAANLTNGNTLAFLDGYVIGDQGGTNGRFQWSDFNDPATYPAQNFATAESSQDRTLAVAVAASTLWVFGEQTIEPWRNAGSAVPWARITYQIVEIGLVAIHSISRYADSLFFLGASDVGGVGVYRLDPNGQAVKVSTDGIDYLITGQGETLDTQPPNVGVDRVDVSDAEGWCYEHEGQAYYVLTFPTLNRTLTYNIRTGRWHERMTGTGGAAEVGRWKAAWCTAAYNKLWIGESSADALYDLSFSQYVDNTDQPEDELIAAILTSAPIGVGERRNFMSNLWLDGDVGLAENQRVELQTSTDGGYVYSQPRVRNGGPAGKYDTRWEWRQMPSWCGGLYLKFKATDAFPRRFYGLYAEGGPGIG